MSASDNPRPNHEKYQARKVAATNTTASTRMGREAGIQSTSGRINPVKHKINDHSRDRHVQPERQRDARDAPVPREVLPQRAIKGKEHERHDHDRKNRVADQDREVDRARQTRSLKTCRAMVVVICEVRDEKENRNHEGAHLTSAMRRYVTRSDKRVTGKQQ